MPTLPIPLFSRSYKNTDGSVLNDDSAVQYNGYIDDIGGVTIRPGEALAFNSGAAVDGLFYWPDKQFIVCVENKVVTLRSVSGKTLSTQYNAGPGLFSAGIPIVFCNDANYVFLAASSKIHYINSTGTLVELADPDAPTGVTHVAFIDGYILAINGVDGKFYWSDIPTSTSWSALSFAAAEGSPDNNVALSIVQRQIYLLGTTSTEIWENDGVNPFSRIPGGLIEVGCIAKYSPIKLENSLIWLSHEKEFVQFTGTQVKKISGRYDKEIQSLVTVYDCIGGLIKKDGQIFCIFQFPTEGRTLVYNPANEDWSEWASWNSDTADWEAYDYNCSVRDLVSGQIFVGKKAAQVIACLDNTSRNDLVTSSTTRPFKFFRQTGHIDHGTSKKKRLEELRFRAKRGGGSTSVPKLMFRYRNDGSNQWSNIQELDLGAIGEADHHIKLKRLGVFKSRQYEISATDDIQVTLSNAEIDMTVLR